jgi:two-component system phosphate regulon sensor histidine kinase PhoR
LIATPDKNATEPVTSSPFFKRLLLHYLLLICAVVAIVGVTGTQYLRNSYLRQAQGALRDETRVVSLLIKDDVADHRLDRINQSIREVGKQTGCRVTVIDSSGKVLADNEADPAKMDNHRSRPEIIQAAADGEGASLRSSDTIHQQLVYFARKIDVPGNKSFFVRVATHLTELDRQLGALYRALAVVAMGTVLAAGLLSYQLARRQTGPIVELTRFADAVASGDLRRRTIKAPRGEVQTLANALNSMAESLGRLISQSEKDKVELLAILSGMSEGIVAIDRNQKILVVNAAAAMLLGFTEGRVEGEPLDQIVHHDPVTEAASHALIYGERQVLQLGPIASRNLEVSVCPFPPSDTPEGAVIVVHDATESVRYQELRKEFVANVSHELRTPLTAIKGFTETLRDGAFSDPVNGPKFLATIEKHTDQLTNLVSDLLELSRLDDRPDLPGSIPFDVATVIRRAVDFLQPLAQKKNQILTAEIPGDLPTITGNADYLERAVANLIDNAIKYTPQYGQIRVRAAVDGSEMVVEVIDNGIGIPADDLPRVFERFYRVDRSRSREMGGTGLGLSIVKHVIQAHCGTVEVSSEPGKGSCFTIRLPLEYEHAS